MYCSGVKVVVWWIWIVDMCFSFALMIVFRTSSSMTSVIYMV